MKVGFCSVVGCGEHSSRRGMCDPHYRKTLKAGGFPTRKVRGLSVEDRLNKYSKLNTTTGCLEWIGSKHPESGYGNIKINGRTVSTHRAAWEVANGLIPNGLHVLHKCDNRCCVNPEHLFVGTNNDNIADMDAKGRRVVARGESKKNSKLKEEYVRMIRSDSRTNQALADVFGVSDTIISMVRARQIWNHVV